MSTFLLLEFNFTIMSVIFNQKTLIHFQRTMCIFIVELNVVVLLHLCVSLINMCLLPTHPPQLDYKLSKAGSLSLLTVFSSLYSQCTVAWHIKSAQ